MRPDERRRSVDLAAIRDNVTAARRGLSFLSEAQLEDGGRWMLRRLARVPAARRLYEAPGQAEDDVGTGGPVRWRRAEARRHLQRIDRFLQLLSLAVHLTGGQPARGPELLLVRWRNGVTQDRNLYVIDGQVVVVTRYHKSQSQWDRPKVIP